MRCFEQYPDSEKIQVLQSANRNRNEQIYELKEIVKQRERELHIIYTLLFEEGEDKILKKIKKKLA